MRLIWLVTLALPTAAMAQPADYSAYELLTIKTLAISKDGSRSAVRVLIANQSTLAVDVRYACTLYDAEKRPNGETDGVAETVPPKQEVVSLSTSSQGDHSQAFCRVVSLRPSYPE